ncbi:MAG TPA: SRPBCC domain-containing protein [Longimicrobiales bacterium]|nr:SRPBCC domain-containing protein [Longimicrobiales bacterium]
MTERSAAERSAADGLEPVRKKVVVPASPEVAFTRFTAELDQWWPLRTHSVHGAAAASAEFGGGVGDPIVERSAAGEESVWGTVTEWDPPRRVAFTWHPGRPEGTAQEVTVTFVSTGDATEVTLVHGGWESLGAGAEAKRREYEEGWELVLGSYRDAV